MLARSHTPSQLTQWQFTERPSVSGRAHTIPIGVARATIHAEAGWIGGRKVRLCGSLLKSTAEQHRAIVYSNR